VSTDGPLVLTERDARGVAFVTVNNPARRNALGNPGKLALAAAMEGLAADTSLRVIVLTGAGDRAFISGGDLAEMPGFTAGQADEGPALTHHACAAIRSAPVLVIARINEYCSG
jgi:enoyl-CoA hydratase